MLLHRQFWRSGKGHNRGIALPKTGQVGPILIGAGCRFGGHIRGTVPRGVPARCFCPVLDLACIHIGLRDLVAAHDNQLCARRKAGRLRWGKPRRIIHGPRCRDAQQHVF